MISTTAFTKIRFSAQVHEYPIRNIWKYFYCKWYNREENEFFIGNFHKYVWLSGLVTLAEMISMISIMPYNSGINIINNINHGTECPHVLFNSSCAYSTSCWNLSITLKQISNFYWIYVINSEHLIRCWFNSLLI